MWEALRCQRDPADRSYKNRGTRQTGPTRTGGPGKQVPQEQGDTADRSYKNRGTRQTGPTRTAGPGRPIPQEQGDPADRSHKNRGTRQTGPTRTGGPGRQVLQEQGDPQRSASLHCRRLRPWIDDWRVLVSSFIAIDHVLENYNNFACFSRGFSR